MPERNRVVVSLIGPMGELEQGIRLAISDLSTEEKLQVTDELK
jgi:hypothetical protein